METISLSKFKHAFVFLTLCFVPHLVHSNVTYDRKAILINGQRRILFSGSIHYPRSTPDMWKDLVYKAKEGGLDVIETYVFWNVHEPSPGNYNFEGRYDLVRFVKTIQKAGLYAHLRIGPYRVSCLAERAMQGFTEKVVGMMKSEHLYESQGGPIILSQGTRLSGRIENEYGPHSKLLGAAGQNYVNWAAKMAVEMGTGVPWVMCKEDNAPDPVVSIPTTLENHINTCNGFYCDQFTPNKPYKPTIWTEAWSGWFSEFGGPIHKRPVQDLAFAVGRFIQKGGSFVNYYMYHGGTNFGRTAGGPFITTSYDYDAPLDEYGLIRQPKYGHLKELHKAIKMCEQALVSADPVVTSLGNFQQAHVYSTKSGDCAAFLSNYDTKSSARVMFNNMHYNLPPWSISILLDCRNAVFNTAKVGVQTSQMQMLPTNTQMFSWESFDEDVSSMVDSSAITVSGLLEQINVTRDTSDYLWYITSVDVGSSESFLHGGELPTLIVQSTGHAVHVFINGQLSGSGYGTREDRRFRYIGNVNLRAGTNRIALLSVAVGLPNVGGHFETWNTGILGPIALHGLDQGNLDLSWKKWTYQVGLKGEAMDLASPNGISSVEWMQTALVVQKLQPLTWHKTYFNAPEGYEPLALDMEGMGKGQIWINGQSIGRYWIASATDLQSARMVVANQPRDGKDFGQNTRSQFHNGKKVEDGKEANQYHVPRSWLKPDHNLLVVFEELGGDPSRISLVKRTLSSVCADVSEYHPNIKNWHIESYGKSEEFHPPKVHLHCSPAQAISSIKFASFGTPLGTCGNYVKGACHSAASYEILDKKCIGKVRCIVTVLNTNFGEDPCPNVLKRLSVEAVCSPTATRG
ncbi:hypothetical protein Lal_00027543 [Lupinus albus]|nr:hypothetical protein Lal_00027543 [Lupinus albus]